MDLFVRKSLRRENRCAKEHIVVQKRELLCKRENYFAKEPNKNKPLLQNSPTKELFGRLLITIDCG